MDAICILFCWFYVARQVNAALARKHSNTYMFEYYSYSVPTSRVHVDSE